MNDSFDLRASHLLECALDQPSACFRDGQLEAIKNIVEDKKRVLIVQRTGWGKSMVYFLATRMLRDEGKGPTLLISPLLALMRNQIEAAERIGLRAATINSSNREEWHDVREGMSNDEIDILLISPERLANDEFRETVLLPVSGNIGLLVIDEAHCISDWGHDFRPDYLRIARIIQNLPKGSPLLTTTATANERVIEDLVEQFGDELVIHRGPLIRHSLSLQNIYLPKQSERMAWLADKLPKIEGSGIIYTLTIRDCQRLASWLRQNGIDAHAYWGGLDNLKRRELEQKLLKNEIKTLVATTALCMGFDKPDLEFVIHFQRPGSVVFYYQQVGRAGRALENAHGILLSGDEDDEITDYFIRTAFPPEAHVSQILQILERAEYGLSIPLIQKELNLQTGQIQKALKILAVQTPSPVVRDGSKWFRTPVEYSVDREEIERLQAHRRIEQSKMLEYIGTGECLMKFLSRELDDPDAQECGKCANCLGKDLLSRDYPDDLLIEAVKFLKRSDLAVEPRKMWPIGWTGNDGWRGRIKSDLKCETGRALCLWGDAGWGEMVRRGKRDRHFMDELVNASAGMILKRWKPDPFPAWVTCVPSLSNPELVPSFASRLARAIGIPFRPCIAKSRPTKPQKEMQNSAMQATNLDGSFTITTKPPEFDLPVLLVDDIIDSRWTMTLLAAILRSEGSGQVYPMALANATPDYYSKDKE